MLNSSSNRDGTDTYLVLPIQNKIIANALIQCSEPLFTIPALEKDIFPKSYIHYLYELGFISRIFAVILADVQNLLGQFLNLNLPLFFRRLFEVMQKSLKKSRSEFIIITLMYLGFLVVITLHVITRNTFFHLRRSITRNYMLIMYTKESLVSCN